MRTNIGVFVDLALAFRARLYPNFDNEARSVLVHTLAKSILTNKKAIYCSAAASSP